MGILENVAQFLGLPNIDLNLPSIRQASAQVKDFFSMIQEKITDGFSVFEDTWGSSFEKIFSLEDIETSWANTWDKIYSIGDLFEYLGSNLGEVDRV